MTIFAYPRNYDPLSALDRLEQELEGVFSSPWGFARGPSGQSEFPALNVVTDEDGALIQLDVPGIAPENLSISATGQTLTIRGKREPALPADGKSQRQEGWTGEFSRSLQVSRDLDLGKAEADYKHGVLGIRLPRREESRPRQIEVRSQ